MKIAIIGAGYVGLVSGACFAEFGTEVCCIDSDREKVSALEKGDIPFYEPGLRELVVKNHKQGRLRFSTSIGEGIEGSKIIFIAVGTPPRGDGSADLRYVDEVASEIARSLKEYAVVVTKSTVPVGTGRRIKEIIERSQSTAVPFDVAANPEFLREGAAIEDFMRPNRVVLGVESEESAALLKKLYGPLYLIETPFVVTDLKTAELIKYASNSFLATKISFINEIANLCDCMGVDVHTVARAMGLDGRIGSKFLHPGPGFGGSCFPKDLRALGSIGRECGEPMHLVETAAEVNRLQMERAAGKVRDALSPLEGKTLAVLGLSFKPNTDDIREAPSISIISELMREGAAVRAYDPEAMENARGVLGGVEFASDAYSAMEGADALLIVTEWNEFRGLDLEEVKRRLKSPFFFDFRNIYEPDKLKEMGFEYYATGRDLRPR